MAPPPPPQKNIYQPLPLGSDAFLPPLPPPPERTALFSRKLVLLCAGGACCGALLGAVALAFALRETPQEVAEVGLAPEPVKRPRPADPAPVERTLAAAAAEAAGHLERSVERAEAEPAQPPPAVAAGAEPAAATAQEAASTLAATAPADAAQAPAETKAAAEEEKVDRHDRSRSRRATRQRSALPDKPSRAQVLAAMSRVQGRVKACFGGAHGVVTADMTVLGRTGRVTTAQISGQSGAIGSCVARAVRKAKFPKFATESISIRYPMKF